MSRTKVMLLVTLALLLIAVPVLGACTKEVIKEVPVEKVVEKEVIKEVIVEKTIEKEVIKEVPVEKIVEKVIPAPVLRKPKGTLTMAVSTMGNEQWLTWMVGGAETHIMYRALDSIMTYDVPTADKIGSLAEKFELSEDALTATYWLRKGIQFHDGWGELTAEDVCYTFERNMEEGSRWTERGRALKVKLTCTVEDPYKVVFQGVSPYPRTVHVMARVYGMVMSKKYIETVGDEEAAKKIIGTGPWRFVEHRQGEYVRFEAVEEHWRQTPYFKTLIFRKVPEEATRIAMLKAGEVDIIELGLNAKLEVEKAGFEVRLWPTTIPIYVNFGGQILPTRENYNDDIPWVGQPDDENALKVRMALNLAVDKEAIAEHVLAGGATLMSVPTFNEGEPWSDPSWKPYPYDPEKAKQLLTEAGYPDGFKMKLISWSLVGRTEGPIVAEAVSIYWERIGVTVELQTVEYSAFRPEVRSRTVPDMTSWVYVGSRPGADPLSILSTVAYGFGSTNLMSNEYPETDVLIAAATAETNKEKNYELQRQIGDFIYNNYSTLPIATKGMILGLSDRVGYWPMPTGEISYPREYAYIEHAK